AQAQSPYPHVTYITLSRLDNCGLGEYNRNVYFVFDPCFRGLKHLFVMFETILTPAGVKKVIHRAVDKLWITLDLSTGVFHRLSTGFIHRFSTGYPQA